MTSSSSRSSSSLHSENIKEGHFRTFWQNDSDCVNLFKTGEIAISSGYQGLTLQLTQEGTPNNYVLAEDGQMLWVCGYGISADAKNTDAAYALINYYLSPEAEAYEAEKWYYLVANQDALPLVSDKVREEAQLDSVAELQNPVLGHRPTGWRSGSRLGTRSRRRTESPSRGRYQPL